jgi:hypothetical protein
VVLGYITAVTVPPAGFILGVALAIRPTTASRRHGAWIVALSVVAAAVWIVILGSGVVNTTSTAGS